MTTLADIATILADAPRVSGVVVLPADQAREMAQVARRAAEGVPTLLSKKEMLARHEFLVNRIRGILARHLPELLEIGAVVAPPVGGEERVTYDFDEPVFLEWYRTWHGKHRPKGQSWDTQPERTTRLRPQPARQRAANR